ncbi:hypothetical protein G4D82_06065 [Flavobacterium sp. CYK-4]|uniref:hypothetical protein n=1 Tax=Flavobacterium lotistagni TaxID=2709660 RepID=UPI00140A0EB0|nr:hypothetical protein [Flavobacterium lotistagni]NHM06777.1 hypothetical protein [Flavobacterium lotistagni]
MKKHITALIHILFFAMTSMAQINVNDTNLDAVILRQGAGKVFRNPKNSQEKILGSPYHQLMFAQAKVDNVAQKYFMRYNNYADEFEFITPKNDTLVLDKIDDFSNITILGTNKKYKLVTYSPNSEKPKKGYLIELYQKSSFGLYKREWTSYYAGKKAKTTLEKDMPPRYNKEKDYYYLKDGNGNISDFPESKKQLFKLFPDKKEAIETFVKDNKIDFDLEADRIKIINFLAQ